MTEPSVDPTIDPLPHEQLALVVSETPPPQGLDNGVRVGVVRATLPLVVNLQGGQVVRPGQSPGVIVDVGMTVALLRQDQTWLCLGAIAPYDTASLVVPNSVGVQVFPGGFTNTGGGTAFVGLPISFFFRKYRASTQVRLGGAGSWYHSNGAAGGGEFGAQINGINHVLARQLSATITNNHIPFSGFKYVAGLPAATYLVLGVMRSTAAGNTTSIDANDYIELEATEVR